MWLYPKAQTLAPNIFYSKNNGRLSHSHILNPRELTLCPKEIQKRIDVGWTIRRCLNLRLENRVGWMEKGQHRGEKRKLGKILSSYYAQDRSFHMCATPFSSQNSPKSWLFYFSSQELISNSTKPHSYDLGHLTRKAAWQNEKNRDFRVIQL